MGTIKVKYEIEWCNGEREVVSVPGFIQPSVVREQLPHSELWMLLKKGFYVYAVNEFGRDVRIDGPAKLRVKTGGKLYV